MKTGLQDERGAALVLALIVMTGLSLLLMSSLEILTTSIQIAGNHIHDIQAMYIADAGVEDAIKELRANPNWNAGFTNKSFGAGSYTVTVTNTNPIVDVQSTGTVSNFSRTIQAEIQLDGDPGSSPPYYSIVINYWREV